MTTMTSIRDLLKHEGQSVTLCGWIANKRSSGKVAFLVLRDGSGFAQCVADIQQIGEENFEAIKRLTLESSVKLVGNVVRDEKQAGGYEVHLTGIEIYHIAEEYPIAKKEHGADFLINNRHLWLRSSRQWAIMRIRNQVQFSIHNFFQQRGFVQMDAPILTGNACEGTTTLFETDFYEEGKAYLSQSGQLYGEAMAMAMGKIYTFGPTFRAEKSKTPRHLSEFWMIEPEIAFCDLDTDMALIEEFIRAIVQDVWNNCRAELETLERNTTLFENIHKPFPRLTYEEAVDLIRGEATVGGQNALELLEQDLAATKAALEEKRIDLAQREAILEGDTLKKGEINYQQAKVDKLKADIKKLEEDARNIPLWIDSSRNFPRGEDFGSPNEKALTRLFNTPILVYKWPAEIKAFYMKRFPDDPNYVKGVDCLAPEGFGEIVGGSEREDNYEILRAAIEKHELPMDAFQWYLDLRRFGSVPHAGFGLGFERVVMWLTGVSHIRETIPFPRYYGRLFP